MSPALPMRPWIPSVLLLLTAPLAAAEPRFELEAFLTAAYVDGQWVEYAGEPGTAEPLPFELTLGTPDGGSGEFFRGAVRGSYRLGTKDRFQVQLSHRTYGDSPLTDAEDAVKIDRAFYQHDFGPETWVRLGRVPVPFGLLNEVRHDATELPFFRVPFAFYRAGGLLTEYADGLRARHRFGPPQGWGVELDVYAGQWTLYETQGAINRLAGVFPELKGQVLETDAENGWGGALWFHAPGGFRLGYGTQRYSASGGGPSHLPGESTDRSLFFTSLEWVRNGWTLRGEVQETCFPVNFAFTAATVGLDPSRSRAEMRTNAEIDAIQAQLGYRFKWGLQLFFQFEQSRSQQRSEIPTDFLGFFKAHPEDERSAFGFSAAYHLNPNWVLRAETHLVDAQSVRLVSPFEGSLTGAVIILRINPEEDGQETLVSLAYRF